MPFIQNTRKTPLVCPSSSGVGAGTTIEAKGFKSLNGISEIPLRDWLAFRENWLGRHALENGWIRETDERPKPRTPESAQRERDDDDAA